MGFESDKSFNTGSIDWLLEFEKVIYYFSFLIRKIKCKNRQNTPGLLMKIKWDNVCENTQFKK